MHIKRKYIVYLNTLLEKSEISVADLQEEVGKSTKTIIKELDELELVLKKKNILLIRKQGKGIWLECDDHKRFELQEEVRNSLNSLVELDGTQKIILYMIAFECVTIEELAKKNFMSRSSISKNILFLTDYLKRFNIEVASREKILMLTGKEISIRKLLFDNAIQDTYVSDLIKFLKEEKNNINSSFFLNEHLYEIEKQQNLLFSELNIKFSDQSLVELHIYFTIICLRIKKGISINEYDRVRIHYTRVHQLDNIVKFYQQLANACYDIFLDVNETKYISYIVANHSSIIVNEAKDHEKSFELLNLIKAGLKNSNYLVNYDLLNDKELIEGLENHMEPAINRLVNEITTISPYTSQIKNDYELAFNIAKIIIVELQKKYDVKCIADDEVAQIALHLQASIERYAFDKIKKIRIGIVSSSGQGSPQLIKSKLLKQFNNIKSIEIITMFEYYSIDIKKYDLIVSTTYLNQIKVPVINITPLISYNDLNKISNFLIQEAINNRNTTDLKILCRENLCFYTSYKNKDKLIEFLCTELEKNGYVRSEYKSSLITREKISSTDNKLFAIPHGKPSYVIKTGVVFVVNKAKINWGKYSINTIIIPLISLKEQYNAEVLMTSIFKLKENSDFINQLESCRSNNEIFKTVRSTYGKF
ncbi:MAG: BglG family transcription antiterminator [Anaerocolumna sp.]